MDWQPLDSSRIDELPSNCKELLYLIEEPMYVSYKEAARSKLCSISDIRHAVTAGLLRGDESFISWDL